MVIGSNCDLQDAYVGPYTAIGNGVEISGSEIEHSIVLDESSIRDLGERVDESLIGYRAEITRIRTRPAAYRFMIGDDSKVDIV